MNTDDGPVCEKYDMPQAWCAHCRGDVEPRVGPERPRYAGEGLRYWFFARWPGRCSNCGTAFRVGDAIGVTDNDEYVCGGCA